MSIVSGTHTQTFRICIYLYRFIWCRCEYDFFFLRKRTSQIHGCVCERTFPSLVHYQSKLDIQVFRVTSPSLWLALTLCTRFVLTHNLLFDWHLLTYFLHTHIRSTFTLLQIQLTACYILYLYFILRTILRDIIKFLFPFSWNTQRDSIGRYCRCVRMCLCATGKKNKIYIRRLPGIDKEEREKSIRKFGFVRSFGNYLIVCVFFFL